MYQNKMEEINNLPQEQKHPLIELNEAINNLQLLFNPNANQQQQNFQDHNQNPQQQQNFQDQVPQNQNQDERPFIISSNFSDPNSDPSSLKTNISTITEYQNKFNELFQKLQKAQRLLNLEWRKLENLQKFQSFDNDYLFQQKIANSHQCDSSCKVKNQHSQIKGNYRQTYELVQQLLFKAQEDQQKFDSSFSTSSGQDFQIQKKNEIGWNQQVSISLSNLQQIQSSYVSLLKQQQLNQQNNEFQQQEEEDTNIIQQYNLNEKQKNDIKQSFSDLIQNIENSNYLYDEIVTLDGEIKLTETQQQKPIKKLVSRYEDFKPISLSLNEKAKDRFQEYLLRISISQKSGFDVVFPIFEKMDYIQRKLLRIKNFLKNNNNINVQQEIQNCLVQMKKNYRAALEQLFYVQDLSITILYNKIEQIDRKPNIK